MNNNDVNNKKIMLGAKGENLACNYLIKNGYTIIEKNFKYQRKEIDIIVKINNYIVFVEVKTRSNINMGYPSEAVDLRKQKSIIDCANYYIEINDLSDDNFRFDVIEILKKHEKLYLRHIKNAFWVR